MIPQNSPFSLDNTTEYILWRTQKLAWAARPHNHQALKLTKPFPDSVQYLQLMQRCQQTNMALYELPDGFVGDKAWLVKFALMFGLNRLDSNLCADADSVTSLHVVNEGIHKNYIPYSDRPINWHTDGYYNTPDTQIRGMVLHCVTDAASGGENQLLDHELAYIALRDENPNYIRALMHPETMAIPPSTSEGKTVHDWRSGPVFSVHPQNGCLHMRYTARKRNIRWRDDPLTLEAVAFLQNLLGSGDNQILRHKLKPGQGLICNNVLHNRSGFNDQTGHERLLYRARYFDRISEEKNQEKTCSI